MKSQIGNSETDRRRNPIYVPFSSGAFQKLKDIAGDSYYVVVPNRSMLENVMKSWDDRPPYLTTIPHYGVALGFFEQEYSSLFKMSTLSDDATYALIDMGKSGGYQPTFFGLKNKLDTYADSGFQAHKLAMQNAGYDRPAIHKVTPKVEVLPKETIDQNKCRFFVIPELLLLELQVKYGKLISLRLKDYKWSAYGFNPYYGGCHNLAERLLSKRIRFYYDISGWDKFLNVLGDIYSKIKAYNGYRDFSPSAKLEFDWMIENTINMFCIFYDGSVYEKKYGNGSGSGTTTRDNILAHVLIMATILFTAYYEKYGKYPKPSLVAEQVINLFGDDSICSVDECFDFVLKGGFVARIFSHFGMKLKFFFGGLDYPLEKMEFLGFHFFETEFGFIPRYNEERLATSMVYKGVNSNTREAILSKTFILMMMSYPCANHWYFKQFALEHADYYSKMTDLSETERVMINLIQTSSDAIIMSIFLGMESSSPEVFKFFSLGLEEEGIKEFFPQRCLPQL